METLKLFFAVHQSVLRKWLREEHCIDIEIRPVRVIGVNKAQGYTVNIFSPKKHMFNWELGGVHPTYEEALELSLIESLNLL